MTRKTTLGQELNDARTARHRGDRALMQITASAVAHLVDQGHRPTDESIETHFAGECQCKAALSGEEERG